MAASQETDYESLDEYLERRGIDPESLSADQKANLAHTYIRKLEDRIEALEARLEDE